MRLPHALADTVVKRVKAPGIRPDGSPDFPSVVYLPAQHNTFTQSRRLPMVPGASNSPLHHRLLNTTLRVGVVTIPVPMTNLPIYLNVPVVYVAGNWQRSSPAAGFWRDQSVLNLGAFYDSGLGRPTSVRDWRSSCLGYCRLRSVASQGENRGENSAVHRP